MSFIDLDMKYFLLLLFILSAQAIMAQVTPAVETDTRKMSLEERFQNMKAKAESYQDYKVIKALTLDAEWKIFMDSIRANKSIWQEARRSIGGQQAELKNAQTALQQKEASMADVIYASEHISFLGISFSKKTFVVLFVTIVAALAIFAVLLAGRLKMVTSSVKEKADLVEVTQREFEEYKHKALDKQTKLSRELQNERNKLSERHS